jgi:hypothetical protein
MTKYEYLIVNLKITETTTDHAIAIEFDKLGECGWQLVSTNFHGRALFMRTLQ